MLPRLLAAYSQYGLAAPGCPVSENQRCRMGPVPDSTKNGSPTVVAISRRSHGMGDPPPAGAAPATETGSTVAAPAIRPRWSTAWARGRSQRVVRWAYR